MVGKSEARVPTTTDADPLQAFRTEIEKLAALFVRNGGVRPWTSASDASGGRVTPSIDLVEGDDAVVVTFELPGMDERDVDVAVTNGVLTLKGAKTHAYAAKRGDLRVMERRYGAVERTVHLPESADPTAIETVFDKGVLTVTMPKGPKIVPIERRAANVR